MNTVCTHCQAINRIPDDRIEDAAKCGRCGHDLFDGEVINATGETLDKLLKDDLPVVIDFWAPWCGPCRNFAPIFEDVAQERSGKVRFVKVNTEAERELSSRFGIPNHVGTDTALNAEAGVTRFHLRQNASVTDAIQANQRRVTDSQRVIFKNLTHGLSLTV